MQFDSFSDMKGYSARAFRRDLLSGAASGASAFPFVLAFAVASGVSLGQGVVTAVTAALVVGFLGGSRVQISGPLVAFVALSLSIIQQYGFPALAAATALAGALMTLLGVLRMGDLVRFIPRAVISGLSAGVAITVIAVELSPVFGFPVGGFNADFVGALTSFALGLRFLNPWACAMAAATFVIIVVFVRWGGGWIPGSLVALIAGMLAVAFFGIPVETVGSQYVPASFRFPLFSVSPFDNASAQVLFFSAISLALLASVESLMGAAVADGMTGERRDPNRVLFAQGVVNLIVPILGGIPSGGSVSRTASVVRGGARTAVAAFTHAAIILAFSVLLGMFAAYVPVPVLAALVVSASIELIGIPVMRSILRERKVDAIVFCATLAFAVFLDLAVATAFGILLAAYFSLRAGASLPTVKELQVTLRARNEVREARESGASRAAHEVRPIPRVDPNAFNRFAIAKGVAAFELLSPLSFGALERFERYALARGSGYKALVLRMREAIYVDEAGLRIIGHLAAECRRRGIAFLVSDIHTQPYMLAAESGLEDAIGKENFFGNFGEALARAGSYVSSRSLSRREYEQPQ